jgi:hypothetical protein
MGGGRCFLLNLSFAKTRSNFSFQVEPCRHLPRFLSVSYCSTASKSILTLSALLKNLHGLQNFFPVFNNFTIESAKFVTASADASAVSVVRSIESEAKGIVAVLTRRIVPVVLQEPYPIHFLNTLH